MSIEENEKEIIDEFNIFGDDWESRYEYIIDLGKSLPLLSDAEKHDNLLIKGCQSKMWLKTYFDGTLMSIRADSDAIITKGMAALVIRVLNNHRPEEIVNAPLNFIDAIGLKEHLSPTRANGLTSLIKQIKLDALAYLSKGSSETK
ncbi:MAG: SufE family protein [Bacteroidia bacterium]|nr:SufE family protein [Bacteroidia bacterium]MCZ2248257.1 SufE family protein [Bacteroidia bacterium]